MTVTTPRRVKGRAAVRLRPVDISMWPDPPMVPSVALRQCEQAATIEEVRAIVGRFLTPRSENAERQQSVH